MPDIAAFLASLAREPFCYGRTDCALVLGRWWAENHGCDPAAHLIATYHDGDACGAVLAKHGGLLRLVRDLCRTVGARRTANPKPGDIAVVRFGNAHFGAIRTISGKWAIKCTDGLTITTRCRPLMIWSI
ncbi:hypothetical protein KYK30_31740 [Shinella yambaruensis]|uniref:DUF6950 domain-containing protein n=1 Tax=Shinella yambaruensis TaxID=415996 RepID=A0ABQ5ZTP7_9HYPH|nr:hypothetical protein [Shinella yambaruensis]MCJ8030006.1 hypothetical protein [Shinella yambaruensis]MCU7984298.1 hypothetical protein [Shinella yambaruensis]GLR55126.1 hypothetical protein GCM10007923_63470 [Shinella yambaruensis]